MVQQRDVVIAVGPAVLNLSPLGFHVYAAQFLRAARLVRSHAAKKFSPVPYYLYCRALELVLKAFLLAKGTPKPHLRKLAGHDLNKSLTLCMRHGLASTVAITPLERAEISKANAYYSSKGFEYFKVERAVRGYRDLPSLDQLDAACSKLVERLRAECQNA